MHVISFFLSFFLSSFIIYILETLSGNQNILSQIMELFEKKQVEKMYSNCIVK
jgi:hypothetical protein